MILVLSSPSGAGKTTLSKRLLAADPAIRLSISLTTRAARPGEVDGKDYWFVTEQEFERRREAGELLEWATVFGNSYGTPKEPVTNHMAAGNDILFDIDWQGAQQISETMSADLVRVFVLPPSGQALEQRLRMRAQDSELVVAQRMARASDEISHWAEYDYIIINDDLEQSTLALRSILTAERQRRERLVGLADFIREMQQSL